MCCGGSAPNTDGMNRAAEQSVALSQQALKWFQDTYAAEAPQRAAAEQRANQVADAQVGAMNFATQEAQDLSQRRKTVAQPLEDKIIADAQGYDTPERRAAAREQAAAGVEGAFGRAADAQRRQYARMGVDLTGPQAAALMQDSNMAKAKAAAGATFNADQNIEQQGHARMMDAAGLTKGIVSNQATQQGIASQAGTAGVQAGQSALQAAQSGTPMMQAGYSSALQGQQIAGNLYGQAAQIQASANGGGWAQAAQGVGGIMQGLGAMGYSSKRAKMDFKSVDPDEALDAVNKLQVQSWRYRPGMVEGDEGQEHVGPMAQDVQQVMGDDMAPGGEMVDMKGMADANGKALQALTVMFDKLEKEVQMLEKQRGTSKTPAKRARMEG